MTSKTAADVCPITFEAFTEEGPLQPRVLPVCGHTFSRVSLEQLLRLKENRLPVFEVGNRKLIGVSPLVCPVCMQTQRKGRVRSVDDCPPNWQLIHKLRESRELRAANSGPSLEGGRQMTLSGSAMSTGQELLAPVAEEGQPSSAPHSGATRTSHARSTQTV